MSDAFARWRDRRKPPAPAVAASPPVAEYRAANYLNRIWVLPVLLLWETLTIVAIVTAVLYEQDIKEAIPYATPLMVALFVALILSVGLIFPILIRRRHWRLFADRLEIEQRALLWPFGRRIRAVLPLAEITGARHAELIGGLSVVELTATRNRAYRLSPGRTGKGRDAQLDTAGFDAFVDTIARTIVASGRTLPDGGRLRTLWDTAFGLGLLVLIMLFGAALAALGLYVAIDAMMPKALMLAVIGAIFGGMAWTMLRRKWRERAPSASALR